MSIQKDAPLYSGFSRKWSKQNSLQSKKENPVASPLVEDRIWWERAKVPIRGALFDSAVLSPDHPEEIRIQRLRRRLFRKIEGKDARISIERARLMTASYRSSSADPPVIRRAEAIAHVFRKIPISIETDELLAGRPCAFPGTAEIDPEFHPIFKKRS
jgi:pyruvate formate lyase-like protein